MSVFKYHAVYLDPSLIGYSKNTQGAKSKAKSEAPVSFYLYMRLKNLISGGGQGPTELFVSNNVRSITYKFQKIQSLTLDVLRFGLSLGHL